MPTRLQRALNRLSLYLARDKELELREQINNSINAGEENGLGLRARELAAKEAFQMESKKKE